MAPGGTRLDWKGIRGSEHGHRHRATSGDVIILECGNVLLLASIIACYDVLDTDVGHRATDGARVSVR